MKRTGFKPRTASLTRNTRLTRTTELPARPPRQCGRQAAKNAAYGHVLAAEWCPCCGKPGACTPSHVLTTKQHPEHEANPANIIPLCWACHCTWENNKPVFRDRYPAMWAQKMKAMRDVSGPAFRKFKEFNPHLFKPQS